LVQPQIASFSIKSFSGGFTVDWELFGAIKEAIGSIAVIASLVFVGYQLRQQVYIERAKAQREMLMGIRHWVSLPSQNEMYFSASDR
jgi:hypothetical protein